MSAFLFCISDEWIRVATEQELNDALKKWHAVVDKFDWSKYRQTHFDSDRASGWQSNIIRAEAELEARKDGRHFDMDVLVPGYNPPHGA